MTLPTKKVSLIIAVLGVVILVSGSAIYAYATIQYNNFHSQIAAIATSLGVQHPEWNGNPDQLFAVAANNNPALLQQLNDASNLQNQGFDIIIAGAIVLVIAIVLFAVQKLLIKTIDSRIEEAEKKQPV